MSLVYFFLFVAMQRERNIHKERETSWGIATLRVAEYKKNADAFFV